MYVKNDTTVPILFTLVGGGVAHGTILPGHGEQIEAAAALTLSLSSDDGSPLPATLTVSLSLS